MSTESMGKEMHPVLTELTHDRLRMLHNVTLAAVTDDGQYVIRCTGLGEDFESEVVGSRHISREHALGKVGYLMFSWPHSGLGTEACFVFHPYAEQSLRRSPMIDSVGIGRNTMLGWVCDQQPRGFLAPPEVVPGIGGQWVFSAPIPVTIDVPTEFVVDCESVGRTPEEVLRGFIADLSQLQNFVANPRADGYSSNGSDERQMADAYFERAYGGNREWATKQIRAREEQEQREREAESDSSVLMDIRQEFLDKGGSSEEFIKRMEGVLDDYQPASDTK